MIRIINSHNGMRSWYAGLVVALGLLAVICAPARAQTVEYIHTDSLGTPVAVTDAGRNVVERSEYSPYGDLLNRPDADGPGYTGHVQDAITGMEYMQQRYYDPQLGVFLSIDPISAYEQPGSQFQRYRYANSNPYKFIDSDGRQVSEPRSCHSDNSCVSLEQAQAGIGRDGQLMMELIGGSAVAGGGAAVAGGAATVALANPAAANSLAIGVMDVAAGDALGGTSLAVGGAAVAGVAKKASETFFDGTTLQKRVVDQIATGDNHAFPALVDVLAAEHGSVKSVLDSRGNPVDMLTLRGSKNGEAGTFEYVKNKANEIYHRFFNKD